MKVRESDQLKTVWELYDMGNSSEGIEARLSEIENDGEEKHGTETSIAKV